MCKILLSLLLLLNITPVFADYITTNNNFNSKLRINSPKTNIIGYTGSRRENRLSPHYCPECNFYNPYLSRNELSALEKYALNKTYRRENDLERLERLENLAFGASQYGDINTRFKNVENAILSRPKYGTKNSLLNNIANYFNGNLTGLTPSLIPYPSYNNIGGFSSNPYLFTPNPNYDNRSFEQYSNGIFGGGWGVKGENFGTGSSVRILD